MKFNPSPDQRKVLECKDKNILVSASAGTGKTTVMIEKISGLLVEKQATLKQLLVVTFTDMAAYEMKKRLVSKLSQSDDPQILSQLGQIDTCNISTLHSFCSQLIRKYFVEAEIDPAYKIISGTEWTVAYDKVLDETFEDLYREQNQDFLYLVDVFGKKRKDDSLKKLVKSIYSFKVAKYGFDKWLDEHKAQYQFDGDQNYFTLQYNKQLCDDMCDIKQRCENLAVQANEIGIEKLVEFFGKYASQIYIAHHKPLRTNMQEMVEFDVPRFPVPKTLAKQLTNDAQERFVEYCKKQKDDMARIVSKHRKFLKQFCYDELVTNMTLSCEICTKLFDLVQKFCDNFDAYKKQNGCLDFGDLEHIALKVLDVPKVKDEVKQTFKFVFVDEYQDINEIQEEIISRIKGQNNLFLVGDVKQSIYAFRQCAPDIFVQKLKDYTGTNENLVAYLNDNYRSHSDVLEFVNDIFSWLMKKDFGGIDYASTSMLGCPDGGGGAKTKLPAISVDIIAKKEGEKKEQEELSKPSQPYSVKIRNQVDADPQKEEAGVIAEKIREIVGLKIKVDGKEKIITHNDVVLLTRGMNAQTKKIVAELQSRGLPVVYAAKQNLFDSTEIKQLVNLFRMVDNRYDDVATFGCLAGAFCGIDEDEIAEIVVSTKDGQKVAKPLAIRVTDYCQSHDNPLSHRLQAFLAFLDKVTFLSKHLTVTQLVAKIFADTDYVLKVLGLPDGEIRLKKVNDFLASLADKTYNKNVGEFLAFTNAVQDEQVEVESSSHTDAVRVMTIHKSKGLEFPVVFVINCGQKFNTTMDAVVCDKKHGFSSNAFDVNTRIKSDTLSNWFVKNNARRAMYEEEMRILYVAMTRAKSHLYITGCIGQEDNDKDNEDGCRYIDWILSALQENPSLGDKYKLNMHSDRKDDEKQCDLNRRQVVFSPYNEQQVDVVKNQLQQTYQYQFATTLELKAVSSKLHDYQQPQGDEEVCLPKVLANEVDADGLQQNEIGTGYHAVFEHLDFGNKTEQHVQQVVDMLVEKGVISRQVADVIDKNLVLRALCSPLFDGIQNKKVYRELPFMLKTSYQNLFGGDADENMFLQGVIDMLILDENKATVVDYKYTKRPQYIKQNYQKQLDSYAQAVKQILKIDDVKKYVLSLYDGQLIEL